MKSPEELLEFIRKENLFLDISMTIFGGCNAFRSKIFEVPKESIKVNGSELILDLKEQKDPIKIRVKLSITLSDDFSVWVILDEERTLVEIFDPKKDKQDMMDHMLKKFLDMKDIDSEEKLMDVLKDGYLIFKHYRGEEDRFALHRDFFSAKI